MVWMMAPQAARVARMAPAAGGMVVGMMAPQAAGGMAVWMAPAAGGMVVWMATLLATGRGVS